jgi:hypothetical protein
MANFQVIPWQSGSPVAQSMTVNLTVDGSPLTLNLSVNFSAMAGYWVLDIADRSGNPILSSIPVITGCFPASNILAQYAYLRIGSVIIVNLSGSSIPDIPGPTDLNSNFLMVWSDTPSF